MGEYLVVQFWHVTRNVDGFVRLWIVVPTAIVWVLGKDIAESLTVASKVSVPTVTKARTKTN